MFNVEEELKKLPRKPGVYIMRDDKDVILYVGKAINLHNRVRSYFRENIGRGPAIDQMVSLIARFEYIVTDSELEALVLENNLIKENSPKYNTLLKDDKTYPYIKVTVGEDYPRILFSRTMKKDKSRYFGPYTSAAAVKDTIELLNKLYQLRTCNRVLPRDIGIERPCLNYHIKQCLAPCQGYVSKEEYRQQVAGALEFLNGNYSPILKDLEEKNPLEIYAYQYDLVCNGVELSSGAVRNHDPEIMIKAFELVGLGEADVKAKFPAMYNAFCYGAPPHAGIAPGVDRMIMLICGEESIREIIPFPMNKNAQDILMGAPSEVTQKQLDELHIRCTAKEED